MNIELSELIRLKSANVECNENISKKLGDINRSVNDILDNLKSETLTAATKNLVTAINESNAKINDILPRITAFLDHQINAYSTTNTVIASDLDSLNATIASNLGKSN